jgi:hypothetical protein
MMEGSPADCKFCETFALKLQTGKDDDKKESKYQKYIY